MTGHPTRKASTRHMINKRFFSISGALLLVTAVCACGSSEESLKPAKTRAPAAAAAPRTDDALVSETLREFRRRYESRNPSACELVVSSFRPNSSASTTCEEAVREHALDYAIVALSREGNRLEGRRAVVLATVRRDRSDARPKPVDGRIILRKEGAAWLIASIRPR